MFHGLSGVHLFNVHVGVFPPRMFRGLSRARRPPPTAKELPRVARMFLGLSGVTLVESRPSLALRCILHHGWCAWPGGWTVFRPLKQSGTFMPTPLEEGITTAGVPRHYAHSYERCRTPQSSIASPIPMRREGSGSAGDAAPRHFCCAARGTRSTCSEGVDLIH